MLIQIDEKSVTLTPFGSLALNGAVNVSRGGGQSWIEMIRKALSQADQSRSDQQLRGGRPKEFESQTRPSGAGTT
jgi:hypothetical protein